MTQHLKITAYVSLSVIALSLILIIFLFKTSITSETSETSWKPVVNEIDSGIRVAVLNGCGREGLAVVFSQKLRTLGFDVVNGNGGNADSFDFDFSVVVDRKGNKNNAEAVAKALGIKNVLDQYSANPYTIEDVVVVLGRDWDSLIISKEVITD